jgi:chaperonin GroEL
MSKIGVLKSPALHRNLKAGFNALADTLSVTLGPAGRHVLIENSATSKPEIYSDGATIARRIIEVPGRAQNIGLMMMRNLVWETHLQAGDGTAIAAVLAQSIYNEAYKLRAAGANVADLRRGIERATEKVSSALLEGAKPIRSEDELAQFAFSITGEPELSRILGEMFDVLGENAHITIENYLTPTIDREYHQGGYWRGRLASPHFISESSTKRAILSECPVILFDGILSEVGDVQAIFETVTQVKPLRVVIIARTIRGEALNALITAHHSRKIEIIAAELQEVGQAGTDDFDDLAALTGGTVFSTAAGIPLTSCQFADLGWAMRVEADQKSLVFVGRSDQIQALQERINALQARKINQSDKQVIPVPDSLGLRIARLSGSAGTLRLGASTEAERNILRQKAETCVRVLPAAMRHGILPGGGVAYLNCIPCLDTIAGHQDEAWGVSIISRALEAPFKRIVCNSGHDAPEAVLQTSRRQGKNFGFDTNTNQISDLTEVGIWDAADVLITALQTASSGAVMALTIDSVVLGRHRQISRSP